ncbi:helix-turn-helix domain-containing protein [Nostoc sp. PCC 9305]|uniref:helix-turn-helix domain-containing protein n=1 Tax=Nostoc sp. PCC 9305 TaxID=296636 RepID=UPI0039C62FEF
MINIFIIDEYQETKNILIKSLVAGGFDVTSIENGFISIKLVHDKFPTTVSSKLNIQNSIFPSIPRLHKVFEFIELNYHQKISLKEVAQAVGYSSAYLTDLVRHMTTKTVNDWIVERRIVQASILLLETNDSVEKIALKVGYQNINHFYCQFRYYYKNTPCAWRKMQLSKV